MAGGLLWGVLTVACSSAVDTPSSSGERGWGGELVPVEREPVQGDALAIAWDEAGNTDRMYRLDAAELRLHGGLRLGTRALRPLGASPDGSLLLASAKDVVRIVDLEGRMEYAQEFDPRVRGLYDAVWVDEDLAILVGTRWGRTDLALVRPSTGTVVAREWMSGTAFAASAAGSGLAVLVAEEPVETPRAPKPVTLAVMDGAGAFATRRIDAVGAGFFSDPETGMSRAYPALAAAGTSATVVGTYGTVVSIDLDDLDVRVEGDDTSLFEALAAWFTPPAHAKVLDATELRAEWISPGELLLSGHRTTSVSVRRYRSGYVTDPAGAVVLHADDWSATVLDEDAYDARVAGNRVLAWTEHRYGDQRHEGIGLRAFDSDGSLAWRVLDRQFVRMLGVHDGIAIVEHGWHRVLVSAVDVRTGEVLRTRPMSVSVVEP